MKNRISVFLGSLALAIAMTMGITVTAYAKGGSCVPEEGYYKIVAVNGNGKGQELYYDKTADSHPFRWKDEGTLWYIALNPHGGKTSYIYLADNRSNMLEVSYGNDGGENKLKMDNDVWHGHKGFCFYCQSGSNLYDNLFIYNEGPDPALASNYKLNRHKVVIGKDYVNIVLDSDTNNKLWKLVRVAYYPIMKKAGPTLTAKSGRRIRINWDKLRKKVKSSKAWKKAKYIEIQYSTNKGFTKNVKTKKIKKKSVNKAKARTTLSKLKKKKTYYIRVRLVDGKGVYTNWSKTVKIKTKK